MRRIIGLGTDIVEIDRIRLMRGEHGEAFDARCFTSRERAYAAGHRDGGHAQLAGRFAAKEATLKALGTGLRDGMAWTDIEVMLDPLGAPLIRLEGAVAAAAAARGIDSWMVSISHGREYAVATVICGAMEAASS